MKPLVNAMKRKIIIGIVFLSLTLACIWGWHEFSNNSPANKAAAISTACAWARLAPFPDSAEIIRIEIRGNMFIREFQISFKASPQIIQKWLNDSPGTSEAIP